MFLGLKFAERMMRLILFDEFAAVAQRQDVGESLADGNGGMPLFDFDEQVRPMFLDHSFAAAEHFQLVSFHIDLHECDFPAYVAADIVQPLQLDTDDFAAVTRGTSVAKPRSSNPWFSGTRSSARPVCEERAQFRTVTGRPSFLVARASV